MKTLHLTLIILTFFTSTSAAHNVEITFEMPETALIPGSNLALDLTIENPGFAKPRAILYVALNIGTAEYWFYPSWSLYPPDTDFFRIDVEEGASQEFEIIPALVWPSGLGENSSAMFLGILVFNGIPVSHVAQIDFGWSE